MSHIHGQIILAENAAGTGMSRLKVDASGRLEVNNVENEDTLTALVGYVDEIEGLIETQNAILAKTTGRVLLTSADGLAAYADSLPIPFTDINNRLGWAYEKIAAGTNKFNYYFFSTGNTALTFGDFTTIASLVTVDKYAAVNDLPIFSVYSKMTGSGDSGTWYKSRKSYSISAGQIILLGERVEMWSGDVAPTTHTRCRQVEFNNVTTVGTALDSEEILTISIGSDSGAAIGVKILVENVGYDLFTGAAKIEHRLDLATM